MIDMLNAFKVCGLEEEYNMFFGKKDRVPPSLYEYKLPIEYLDSSCVHTLSDTVISDLELDTTMYNELLMPNHVFAKQMISNFKYKFTSNTDFLYDTQAVIANIREFPTTCTNSQIDCDQFITIWKELKEDAAFLEKYSYMEWSLIEYLNHSSDFLQSWSVINMISPIASIFFPIILLVLPFALLRVKGVQISIQQYIDTLREIAKHHFIGKMLNIKSLSFENIVYILFTAGLYIFQMYQNTMSCIRFYNNLQHMNSQLVYMKSYIQCSIQKMTLFIKYNRHLPTYTAFCANMQNQVNTLMEVYAHLETINEFELSLSKCLSIGYMLKQYYKLHDDKNIEDALKYSVGFEGYLSNMEGIYKNKLGGIVHNAHFTTRETRITEQYYPIHKFSNPVKNNCKLTKCMIITGVNASGKTTFLKTTALNIIFTQQFGVGFYTRCEMKPYTHIHSYLNIPDTSGRDSLFQAESRRCKEILDVVKDTHPSTHHFCIFDELYSGTNPKDASKSAYSFLHYLSSFMNVDFILTTHYVKVCRKLKKHKRIANYKMDVICNTNGELKYTYKLKKGISSIEGGIQILKQMDYPKEIIEHIISGN